MSSRTRQEKRTELAALGGWLCVFCGEGIDPALAWPHPMHATLHHAVADGGSDQLDNLRLAHHLCHQEYHRTTEQEAA
jgi:hypothetical protein